MILATYRSLNPINGKFKHMQHMVAKNMINEKIRTLATIYSKNSIKGKK
jgi:hypothetical protein